MNKNQMIESKELFEALDIDKVGSLSYNKIFLVLNTFGIPASKAEILNQINKIDYNKKGVLTFNDFDKLYRILLRSKLPSFSSLLPDLDSILPNDLNKEQLSEIFPELSHLDIDLLLDDLGSNPESNKVKLINKIRDNF
jgi:hypothetical protein